MAKTLADLKAGDEVAILDSDRKALRIDRVASIGRDMGHANGRGFYVDGSSFRDTYAEPANDTHRKQIAEREAARAARRTAWLEEQVARIRSCDKAVEILRDACLRYQNID